jgi:molybdopterin synthase catalytic subunit/GNAT superfamily N-acetyltransferase
MKIRPLQTADRAEWFRMRRALWPTHAPEEIDAEMREFESARSQCGKPAAVFVADRGDGRLAGFVECTLRPFADGCRTSPVGYIEGWYVDEDVRREGFGRELVRAAEDWARSRGCREMGSDCLGWNHVSFTAHHRIGYRASDDQIGFHRSLGDAAGSHEPQDWIALVGDGLSMTVGAAVKLVTDAAAGGIAVFLGTTRAEDNAAKQPLVALDYEAYPEMSLEQMRDLARRARERWPIARLALLHRSGRVAVGEPSVIIAVASPHRAEAFDACEWLIDTLKNEVAIWKKEVWADGAETWVDPVSRVPPSPQTGKTPRPSL